MSLVLEYLQMEGYDLSDTIPMLEGGNIDMVAEWMSKDGRSARRDIYKANKMFKAGNYRQAAQLYTSAKERIVDIRKNVNKIRTNPGVDTAVNTAFLITLFTPIVGLIMSLSLDIERMALAGDSYSMIDQQKLNTEYGNTTNVIRNLIVTGCRSAEIACDDKIRRCKTQDR